MIEFSNGYPVNQNVKLSNHLSNYEKKSSGLKKNEIISIVFISSIVSLIIILCLFRSKNWCYVGSKCNKHCPENVTCLLTECDECCTTDSCTNNTYSYNRTCCDKCLLGCLNIICIPICWICDLCAKPYDDNPGYKYTYKLPKPNPKIVKMKKKLEEVEMEHLSNKIAGKSTEVVTNKQPMPIIEPNRYVGQHGIEIID